jgi:predicted nuclease of restriction endonuclease-like (RecB) superfamily
MPELNSEALDQLATDPYRLDFLLLDPRAREHALELAMVDRITEFLTHLGRGFAYLGRQWRLTVGDSDFFLDLAFYNTHLHAFLCTTRRGWQNDGVDMVVPVGRGVFGLAA